jgi:Ankyrin repeats (many copies)
VLPVVKAAFATGGAINAENDAGDTALHAAVTHRYEAVIQYLVDHGADINARNKQGMTPLRLVEARRVGGERPTASTVAGAANSGGAIGDDEADSQRVAALLRQLGAEGESPAPR